MNRKKVKRKTASSHKIGKKDRAASNKSKSSKIRKIRAWLKAGKGRKGKRR